MSDKHAMIDLSDLAVFAVPIRERDALRKAGNDLMDALLTAAPSTMYPRIVQDAMHGWLDAIGVPRSPAPHPDDQHYQP